MKRTIKLLAFAGVFAASPTLCSAQTQAENNVEGIWQLSIPSRNNDKDNGSFVLKWKIYSGDGHFTTMVCNSPNESATISASGKYIVENDSIVLEKTVDSNNSSQVSEERVRIKFIGNSLMTAFHNNDSQDGEWQELWKRITSKNDESVMPYVQNKTNAESLSCDLNGVYFNAEKMPKFSKGNDNEMKRYIAKKLKYPEEAQQKGLEGISMIRFVVNEKGKTENLQVFRSSHPILDKEAMRVIKTLTFTPGSNNGKKVKVYLTLPVAFKLK